jgi:hypothetical protein
MKSRARTWGVGFLLVAATAVVGAAVMRIAGIDWDTLTDGTDDRPPIIVRDGSIIFDGGDVNDPADIKTHWTNWVADGSDMTTDLPTGRHVDRYDVTVTELGGTACSAMSGQTVDIAFSDGTRAHMYVKRKNLIFRREPKITIKTKQTPANIPVVGTTTPARLEYGAPRQGSITEVRVDSASCTLKDQTSDQARNAVRVHVVLYHIPR